MEPVPQVVSARSDESAPAGITFLNSKKKDAGDLALRDASPASSTHAMEDCESLSKHAESVASECSEASDAQSVEWKFLEAAASDKILKRCPSGGSIVTYDGAPSELRESWREEGECERTRNRQPSRRPEGAQSNSLEDEQAPINEVQNMDQSGGPGWTEDKHCSYLNSIERTFVNSMYGQDYRTVEGSDDQDCVESRPMYGSHPYSGELFTSLQRGCYDQREYYRPQFIHVLIPYSPAIFLSPWIQHFNPKATVPAAHGGAPIGHDGYNGVAGTSGNLPGGLADGDYGVGFVKEEVKEEVMESFPEFSEVARGLQNRCSRYQGHHTDANGLVQGKKRSGSGDPCSDTLYRPKKLKSTQRLLAAIDLEMEEQFVLKQKHMELAENSGLKASNTAFDGEHCSGLDLNRALDQVEETGNRNSAPFGIQESPMTASPIIFLDQPMEMSRVGRVNGSVSGTRNASQGFKSFEGQSGENVASKKANLVGGSNAGLSDKFNEGKEGHSGENVASKKTNLVGGSSAESSDKLNEGKANVNSKTEWGLDEEAELDFLPKKSPRASKTYTWGSIGTRRRLHKDCNVVSDAA